MAAYRRVYDSRHLQADCQEPGSAREPYTLGNRVWASFLMTDAYETTTWLLLIVLVRPSCYSAAPHDSRAPAKCGTDTASMCVANG